LTHAFLQDERKNKVNLGVGLYKDAELKTPILQAVKKAEMQLLQTEKSKEYLPIDGDLLYLQETGALVFGKTLWHQEGKRIASFQTLGGTGALKVGAAFLQEELNQPIWIPTPTWPNHRGVFTSARLKVDVYPYYDFPRLDFEKMVSFLKKLPPKSIVLLHACCHNPTGCDPTVAEWKILSTLFCKYQLIPFFDLAYQGLGEGLEEDATPLRHFLTSGLEMVVAVSHSKNLSLYAERVGALFVVSASEPIKTAIVSRIKQIIRTNYSNPPLHGAKVAALVFGDVALRKLWERELSEMRNRLIEMRTLLAQRLSCPALQQGKGMFGFLELTPKQVDRLMTEYGIYMPSDGRINMCGLNANNIDYVVDAINHA
jgi:aspartate/tyrosine/aromatic aminotransferase